MTEGPDLFGKVHVHDFTVPWRDYLMCNSEFCGKVAHPDGTPLTLEERVTIHETLRKAYA